MIFLLISSGNADIDADNDDEQHENVIETESCEQHVEECIDIKEIQIDIEDHHDVSNCRKCELHSENDDNLEHQKNTCQYRVYDMRSVILLSDHISNILRGNEKQQHHETESDFA